MAGANNISHGYDERRGEEDAKASLKGEEEEVSQSPNRKKQKRNKPTLSCLECVERKTKVQTLSLAVAFEALLMVCLLCSATGHGLVVLLVRSGRVSANIVR
jgi:hypothetical protein